MMSESSRTLKIKHVHQINLLHVQSDIVTVPNHNNKKENIHSNYHYHNNNITITTTKTTTYPV